MSREMLVNITDGQECRIAVVEDGSLEELYIERAAAASHVGNIYRGRVVNVEPGIQAAFVDFGTGKNGFLHISDLHPRYFERHGDSPEKIGRRKAISQRPPIQKCLKKGSQIVVQVTKEGINTKGPTLSTYISLPGRYVVLMPWMHHVGVSQKIEDEAERKKLRQMTDQFKLPKDSGLIVRTAARFATKRELANDVGYLCRLWIAITKRMETESAPCEIYKESDLVIRTVRDIFDTRINKITCDSEQVTKQIKDFLGIVQPRLHNRAVFYNEKTPLFYKYGIENQISKIQSSSVELKSGGSLVIEQTEALVAIDVNSGKYRKQDNAEQTALKINIEAAKEIVRQLKLRDMGGLIICDFIDMRNNENKRAVEKAFRDTLKDDRAKSKVLRMSAFGIIELTRQRMRPSLVSAGFLRCPRCRGSGIVRSMESEAIEILRTLSVATANENVKKIEIVAEPDFACFIQNQKRAAIARIESETGRQILISADKNRSGNNFDAVCYDERGGVVRL